MNLKEHANKDWKISLAAFNRKYLGCSSLSLRYATYNNSKLFKLSFVSRNFSKNFNRDPLEIDNAEWQSILVARTSNCFFEDKETTSILILACGRSNLKGCSIKKKKKVETVPVVVDTSKKSGIFLPGAESPKAFWEHLIAPSQRHDDLRQMMFLFVLVFDRAINLKQVEYS